MSVVRPPAATMTRPASTLPTAHPDGWFAKNGLPGIGPETDSRKRAAMPARAGHCPVGLRCSHSSCNATCAREPVMSDLDVEPRNRSVTIAVVVAVFFLALLGTGV